MKYKPSWQVIKVNGMAEPYDEGKVADSIFLAAQEASGTDEMKALEVAQKVTDYLSRQFGRMKEISTRDIGDAVERILIEESHVKTAKAFILNRDKKREEHEAKLRLGVRDDLGMSVNSLVVMRNKYLQYKPSLGMKGVSHQSSSSHSARQSAASLPAGRDDSTGLKSVPVLSNIGDVGYETPGEAFDRVALALAGSERSKKLKDQWFEEFSRVMRERKMLPAGRTLANAGTVNNQLANCFVMPFPDDIEGIFDVVKESSVLKKNGGGVGFSFGKIRPKGDIVTTTSGKACGPVALMAILDHASDIFLQAGGRRSGNMVTLPVDHPDIFEFITCKESQRNLPHINYSIAISDVFMKAVQQDADWDLINPRTGEVTQTVRARSIMEQASRLAWENGDPGLIFIDRINRDNPTPHVGPLETVNLCGEQPLLSYEACNLGSVNIAAHVVPAKGKQSTIGDYELDWEELDKSVAIGVRMLDNVVSACTYPLTKVDEVVKGNRKIGLGIMGWADALVRLGIPYNSPKAYKLAGKLMKRFSGVAWAASEALGREKGNFPKFEGSLWQKRGYKYFRNATTTTIAPTGSISMTAGCSYGIEPHFALAFFKKAMGGYELPEVNEDLVVALKRAGGVYSSELMNTIARYGTVQGIEAVPQKIREVFVAAMDMTGEEHVRMQAAFQKYTDNAVSKTINLPSSASVNDVMAAYVLAWETGCKGITVYRDRSRGEQVLNVGVGEGKGIKSTGSTGSTGGKQGKQSTRGTGSMKGMQGEYNGKSSNIQHAIHHTKFAVARMAVPVSLSSQNRDCPECGSQLQMTEGCVSCPGCGYGECSV